MNFVGSDALFATHIAKYSLPDLLNDVQNIYEDYKNDESLWSFNQSENCHLLDNHKTLQNKLIDVARDFLITRLNYNCDVQMTTSWITRTRNKDYKRNKHTHHNSWWSGVYYLHDECALQIDSTLYSMNNIDIPHKEFSLDTAISAVYEMNKGEILLFPSQTPHMVIKKKNKKYKHVRRSIAFNLLPKGKIGNADSSWVY